MRTGHYRLGARTASLDDSPVEFFPAPVDFRPEHIGVADLLRGLRPEYRQVLDLLYLQGYTQLETAEALQVPVGTVKTWSVGARRQLSRLPL
ncbi:RNA polymerase sigma factor [Hymenobacter antarcticus]|uniref:RNA polymerase sigma factor 70 region 4 type 2 domain-containing protein n=1 Tax=Hymenobacter antarcticus TaxID=486270 RepID=A0ABP7R0E9_9BACT